MTGWVALPVLMSSSATRLPWLIGMAKPRPMEPGWLAPPPSPSPPEPPAARIALLMPMTRALESRRGPPELPGLMGASVWRAST